MIARPKEKPNCLDDRNDCTVRALATALDIAYMAAWTTLKHVAGRKKNKGIVFKDYLDTLPIFFERVFDWRRQNEVITVKDFVLQHGEGKYIVTVFGHTFAIINGIVFDYSPQYSSAIYGAWRVK